MHQQYRWQLILQGNASIADYEAALRSVAYVNNNDDNPSAETRTLTITVHDGTEDSAAVSITVSIQPVNDAPTISLAAAPDQSFVEGNTPITPIATATVSDVDNNLIHSARVEISGSYSAGEDLLLFTDTDKISATWDSVNGVLTLNNTATLAEYQSALTGITFHNTSENPSAGERTISYSVNDGATQSANATVSLQVVAVNDPPSAASNTISLNEDEQYVFSLADFSFSDALDNHALQAVSIVDTPAAGRLMLGSTVVADGQLIPAEQISSGNFSYHPVADEFGDSYAQFNFRVMDDGGTEHGGIDFSTEQFSISIDVVSVNDAPTAIGTTDNTHLLIPENSPPGAIIGQLTSTDPDPVRNAIEDGGFTTVPKPFNDANTIMAGEMAGGWLITSGSVDVRGSDWQSAPSGGNAVDLNGWESGAMAQTFQTVAGAQYELRFALAGNFRDPTPAVTMQVELADQRFEFSTDYFDGWNQQNLNWQQRAVSFTALEDTTTITLSSMTPGLFGAMVSDLQLINTFRFDTTADNDGTFDVTESGLLVVGNTPPDFEQSDTMQVDIQSTDIDGLSFTDTVSVEILDVNESPSAVMDLPVEVEDGSIASITSSHLRGTDPDLADSTPDSLNYTLLSPPTFGQLLLNGTVLNVGEQFSQGDINNNSLTYAHLGGYTPNDAIELQLADGGEDNAEAVSLTLPIVVDHVNESPVLQSTDSVDLLEGAAHTLTTDQLNATDGDSNASQLYYVVDRAPQYGQLFSTDDPLSNVTQFTQQDINSGKIEYLHGSGNEPVDSFNYTLFDELDDDGASATSGSIRFNIVDIADAPIGTDNEIDSLELSPVAIDVTDFGFSDHDDGDNFIWAEILSLPSAGLLYLNDEPVFEGQFVPTSEIEQGALVFHPAANASVGDTVEITYRVGDDGDPDNGGVVAAEQFNTLSIHIGDSQPPVAVDDTVAATQRGSISSLSNGDTSVLDNDSDADTAHSDLKAVIVDTVRHGSLQLFADGTFRYVHNGTDNFTDSFSYRIIDGNPADDDSISNLGFVEIEIEPLPPAPTAGLLPDQFIATYDQLDFPLPEDLFQSNAADTELRYSAALDTGAPLPAWLTFDPETGVFSGKPGLGDIGDLNIEITAYDINDKSTTSNFRLAIEPSLDPALGGPENTAEFSAPDTTPSTEAPAAIAQNSNEQTIAPTTENSNKPEVETTEIAIESEPLFGAAESQFDADRTSDTFKNTVIQNEGFSRTTAAHTITAQASVDPIFTVSLERLFFSADESALHSAKNLIEKLDRERESEEALAKQDTQVVASAITISTGLSIGYIVWLVRGGLLVGSVLSSMPAWRWIDPLPVLSNLDGNLDEDSETLQTMVEKTPPSADANADDPKSPDHGA